ncbi:CehA/McbA family metallohydrolase [Paractinoplanes atraurantiacus]|uniref:Predicted metal-dependent phosphoesterase TrpH, contains PHP domain n=1 Tax=Paractinoplanes atraurantiacus TaxID=1036182 RepID=A0A285JS89_9ACTN|nr:CehA/McbA family metallohydrolase [Actinoplanes atraurantiacus]SNY62953.1 Predicted metal-dependent phosphoesterase TrpH, contains PHP domain [Actinoplanes atraurantiacus]
MPWYRGDCHVHSERSHAGELTPGELVTAARAAGLDFIAVTEHNTSQTHEHFQAYGEEDLLVVLGQEVVTDRGHWLALGLGLGEEVDGPDQVHRGGGLCVVAHPFAPYPSGTFRHALDGFDAVEVWNGRWSSDLPWNADNEAALARWAADLAHGRWRPAIGNSDVHLKDQIGTPHSVVRAEQLSTDAVLAGLREGHCWIAESAAVELSFTITAGDCRAEVGDRLETGGRTVLVSAEVRGVPDAEVTFHTDRGRTSGGARWSTSAAESAFVRVEVRHPGGRMAALTNPIFLSAGSSSTSGR